nr:hypothetical protein [Tanacetum cinerariifolium]
MNRVEYFGEPTRSYQTKPHDPDFVPETIYPNYIPLEDEHILPAEEQPLPPVVSPTDQSPGYVAESDLKEYDDDETEDGPVDYPMDGGDDKDDDDGDSSGDDTDDEDKDKDDEEEEEHLAPTDSDVFIPTDELVSPPKGTEPVIPLPSTDTSTTGARIIVRVQAAISLPLEAEMHGPNCITSSALPPPLHMPPPIDCRVDIPETEMPPRKRLCLSTLGSRYEVGESSAARPTGGQEIDYGFVCTLDAEERDDEGLERVTKLAELLKHDTKDLYALLDDAQDSRTHISQRVTVDSQRIDLLMEDKIAHQETIQIMEDEAYAVREALAHSIGLSQAVHSKLQTHPEQVYAHEFQLQTYQTQLQLQSTLIQTQHQLYETHFQMQQMEIAELRETDRRRQERMAETLRVMGDMRREMGDIQAELLALRGQPRRAG